MAKTIPTFESEQEEAEFWDAQDSLDYLHETEPAELTFVDARPRKRSISLRIDGDTINTLKEIAGRKGIGYQTLIRMWVMERLEKEKKAG